MTHIQADPWLMVSVSGTESRQYISSCQVLKGAWLLSVLQNSHGPRSVARRELLYADLVQRHNALLVNNP